MTYLPACALALMLLAAPAVACPDGCDPTPEPPTTEPEPPAPTPPAKPPESDRDPVVEPPRPAYSKCCVMTDGTVYWKAPFGIGKRRAEAQCMALVEKPSCLGQSRPVTTEPVFGGKL